VAPVVIGVGVALDVAASGDPAPDVGELLLRVQEDAGLMMTANTVGQVVAFALLALAVARIHSPDARAYLRLRRPDGPGLALAVVGWAALLPGIAWALQLSAELPLPEWVREMEQAQVDLIEGLLLGGGLSTGFLFVALALTPAVCEELLFRGYLQRQVERRWGAVASAVLVGLVFGLYHLRPSQALPLGLLGVYLGWAVWATGSVWTGVVIHLLHNGSQVLATEAFRRDPSLDPAVLEGAGLPWYFGLAGLAAAFAVAVLLRVRRQSVVGDAPDAAPVDPGPPPLISTVPAPT
jgi:membrane protease YdiL (CAAX protease family)